MVRALFLAVVAVAWPLWLPFLRLVLAEIRLAAKSADEGPAPAPERRSYRLKNAGWDDAHLRSAQGARSPRPAFRAGRGRAPG